MIAITVVFTVGCARLDDSLIQASRDGNPEAAKQAIDDGANVNASGEDGWTSLHHATQNGHKEMARLLVAKGASVNAKIESGIIF